MEQYKTNLDNVLYLCSLSLICHILPLRMRALPGVAATWMVLYFESNISVCSRMNFGSNPRPPSQFDDIWSLSRPQALVKYLGNTRLTCQVPQCPPTQSGLTTLNVKRGKTNKKDELSLSLIVEVEIFQTRLVHLNVKDTSEQLLAPALFCQKEPARASKATY